jgi:hypothetical protein
LEPDALVDLLCEAEAQAAANPSDEDHTVFWLVLADQFEKRSLFSRRVRDAAVAIIEGGRDAAMMRALGMTEADLRRRAGKLLELRARIAAQPEATRPRKTLSEPEPYVFAVGGVYAYPTRQGCLINPYMTSRQFDRTTWQPDGVGLLLVLGRGRAFDYLAWYSGATTTVASFPTAPDRDSLIREVRWHAPAIYGNCTPKRFGKMEMRELGVFAIDPERRAHFFPYLADAPSHAIQDICISNRLDNGPTISAGVHNGAEWIRRPDGKLVRAAYPPPPNLSELASAT